MLKAAYEEAGQAPPDTPQLQQRHDMESSPLDLASRGRGFSGGCGGGGGGGGEMIHERSPSWQSVGGGEGGAGCSGLNRLSFTSRLANRYSVPVGQEISVLEERFSETLDSEVSRGWCVNNGGGIGVSNILIVIVLVVVAVKCMIDGSEWQ